MNTNGWGFAQSPDTDLGEPIRAGARWPRGVRASTDGIDSDAEAGTLATVFYGDEDAMATREHREATEPVDPDHIDDGYGGHNARTQGSLGSPKHLGDGHHAIAAGGLLPPRSAVMIGILTMVLWLGLSMGVAILGQYAAGITMDWRVGLILAAIALGGECTITTHHWALGITTGPLLPGLVVIGAWVGGWAWQFRTQTNRSGVPLRWGQIGRAAGAGLMLHGLIGMVAALVGAHLNVGGQPVWLTVPAAGVITCAWVLPVATAITGFWFTEAAPHCAASTPGAFTRMLSNSLLWLAALGGVAGLVILGQAMAYSLDPVFLALLAPSVWLAGLAMGTGAPFMVQLAEGNQVMHAAWGLSGVSGTLPVGLAVPVAAIACVGTAGLAGYGVYQAIVLTGRRRAALWVIGAFALTLMIALTLGRVSVTNVVAGTTSPPVVNWIATALHNAMAVTDGAVWTLSAGVHWPIAIATGMGLLGVSAGIGVALAGRPSPAWSGKELELSLKTVYKAGLIDQAAFDRGIAILTKAKQTAKARRRAH